jgi:hypothetical protein
MEYWSRREPAAIYVAGLATVISVLTVAFRLNAHTMSWVAMAATGFGTLVVAFMTRPVAPALVSGAAAGVIQGILLFAHASPSPAAVAEVTALTGAVLGMVAHRLNQTPVHAA